MIELIDENIDELIERKAVKDLIQLPGALYNRLLERLRKRRIEAHGVRFLEDSPADRDTPEG